MSRQPFLLLLVFAWLIAAGCDEKNENQLTAINNINATDHSGKTLTVRGTVRTGAEINISLFDPSCQDDYFLVDTADSSATVNSAAVVRVGPTSADEISKIAEFLGKQVEVVGQYFVSSCPEFCCGAVLTVETIAPLE